MATLNFLVEQLQAKGNEKTKHIYARHGMPIERTYGVSIADLKTIAKTIKGQQDLAYLLYETGTMDAMYLAGLVVNGALMTREQLCSWAEAAEGMPMIFEYTVPWATIENPDARTLALEWIGSPKEHFAASGWCTYSGIVATKRDSELDLGELKCLLQIVVKEIGGASNRVKQTMNSFVIALGTYVKPLLDEVKASAEQIGVVSVDKGDTACKVPLAASSIAKIEASGRVGLKRKTMRC